MSGLIDRLAAQAIGRERPAVRATAVVRVRAPLPQVDAAETEEGRFDVVAERVNLSSGTPQRAEVPPSRVERPATGVDDTPLARMSVASSESPQLMELGDASRARADGSHAEPLRATNVRHDPRSPAQPIASALQPTRAVASQRIAAAAPLQDDSAARRTDAGTEPAELHIHIGRIDVTGVDASPGRNRPARQARRSRSLEDYLAGRGRGSP